jgi:RNA polymerase sigma factor (sigma-70 family)
MRNVGSDAAVIRASVRVPSRFAELFDRHFDAIFAYVRRRVGAQLAEDLAAQTFEEAFRHRRRYDVSRADARPWLYGIATNLVRNHLRQERRRLAAYARLLRDPAEADEADAAVARADAGALASQVATALGSLAPSDRDALLLLAWAQLSYTEIAEALGLPIGTVRSRLHRARTQVRERIGARGQEPEEYEVPARPTRRNNDG